MFTSPFKYSFIFILCIGVFNVSGQEIRENIYFANNHYNLDRQALIKLDSLCRKIIALPFLQVEVYGHTDSVASESYNQLLSQQRAKTVSDYLIFKKIDKERIKVLCYGESRPTEPNSNEAGRQKNRRVEVVVKFSNPQPVNNKALNIVPDTLLPADMVFEKDTVIYCLQGTVIEIEAGAFYPYKMKDISFNIQEYTSRCDLINSNINMLTDSGDCLTSGGMLFIRPMVDTVELQPGKGKRVRIKIPAVNNRIDPDMNVYVARRVKDVIVWQKKDIRLRTDDDAGIMYYVFDTDSLLGLNIDKTLQARCEEDGPLVKIKGFGYADMYLTYPNEMYLSKALPVRKSKTKYSLVKIAAGKKPVLTITAEKNGCVYMASGPLLELKYVKKKNMYVVSKKYFRQIDVKKEFSGKYTEDFICNAASRWDK